MTISSPDSRSPNTLVSVATLQSLLQPSDAVAGQVVVVDCRFNLMRPDSGRAEYEQGHIPGAFYAHLDDDLAGPITADSGRHPLPDPDSFSRWLDSMGVGEDTLLIAYDHGAGAIAARLWWMMRWMGHDNAAVLDGGFKAWTAAGGAIDTASAVADAPTTGETVARKPDDSMWLTTSALQENLGEIDLIDARGARRFSGEEEPIDKRAGHIPGAINADFMANLGEDGLFLEPDNLRKRFEGYSNVVHSCGSGVTACHNLLAMEVAGLAGSKLYPGSWSEWVADPDRPIATGK